MNVWIGVLIALRALRAHKLRSGLTMLGIVIGVGAVIAMVAVGAGAQARVAEQIRSIGTNMIVILPGSVSLGGVRMGFGTRPSITQEDAAAILEEIPAVQAAAPWVRGRGQVVSGNLNWATIVQGTIPEYEEARQWSLAAGRFFTQDELETAAKVVVLGGTVAEKVFEGGEAVGQVVRVEGVPLTVVGVLERKGQTTWGQDQDDVVIIPITTANRRVLGPTQPRPTSVNAISVRVREGHDLKAVEEQMRQLLRQRHRLPQYTEDDFNIRNLAETLEAETKSASVLTMLLAAIASISLVVGGIGIMNIMLVSVTERTREIGLRLAVGARSRDILLQFLVEAVTLSLVGGGIGIGVGVAAAVGIAYVAEWRTIVQPEAILLAAGCATAAGLLFGLYPASKAARLNPIEALRYE